MNTPNWINEFLPLLRCPDSRQALRWAEDQDLERHARPASEKGLVTEDGSRYFPIDDGIPILLPQAASVTAAS
jgi:uncharacterized protein YbaR (Trm112 family)